jgi:hypothetical protein
MTHLNLPPDTPEWVRHRLEQLAAQGLLLSEDELKAMLAAPPPPPRVIGQDYEAYLASLQGNPGGARPDIEPEIEDSIPLLPPQPPQPRLKLLP